MAALTQERDTFVRNGIDRRFPVAAGATIYKGSLVAFNAAGYVVPGTTATTLTPLGRAEQTVDNTDGADGDVSVDIRSGVFPWANDGTDTVDRTHVGSPAYIVDDQTVASTDGTGTRSEAGTIFDVDADGVWVRTGL